MLPITDNISRLVLALLCASLLPGCTRILPTSAKQSNNRSVSDIAETGFLFESQGRTENAIECFEKALAMEPTNTQLKAKIASLKSKPEQAENQQAISNLDEVLRRHESAKDLEFKGKTLATPDHNFRTASHSSADEMEFDGSLIGKQSSLDSQDSALEN